MGTKSLRYLLWLLVLFGRLAAFAEGTKQIQPSADKPCKIDILNPNATKFASYQAGPNERLQIRIQNPGTEKIYFGFGVRFTGTEVPATSNIPVYYRIKDPAGNVVAGPALLTDSGAGFIRSFNQALAGPSAAAGTAGYEALSFQPTAAGDYSIEFNANSPTTFNNVNFKFDLFDITVVNTAANAAVPGRLWSKTWDLSTLSFENRLYAKVYIYTPDGVVTSVDYNGMQPFGYTVVANSTGLVDTGNGVTDRKSSNEKKLYPEYPIFFNNPDPAVYPSGSPAVITAAPVIKNVEGGGYCISVGVSHTTSMEVVLEMNGQEGYQAGSTDVLLIANLKGGDNCIPWNGRDGQGKPLAPGMVVKGTTKILNGLVNLPVYDVENHLDGYIITLHRPQEGKQVKVYHDDTNVQIKDVQGNVLTTGTANLDGCLEGTGCHRWTKNFDNTNTATVGEGARIRGMGDEKTINTWWYTEEESGLLESMLPVITQIGLAKAASAPLLQPDGTYNVTYTLTVANLGNVPLTGVQVEDDLSAAFPAPVTFTIISGVTGTGTLVANAGYNGTTDKALLTSESNLDIGATHTIAFTLNLKPSGATGPFYNTAIATGKGPDGTETKDTSTVGTKPDPDDDGNPGEPGEEEPTPVDPQPNPVIGIAKAAGIPVRQADGSYRVTYTFVVRNYGNTPLVNLQVTDNLAKTFEAPATFKIATAPSATGTLVANGAFNGAGNVNLLNGAQSTLAVGEAATITVTVDFKPNGASGPFLNTAIATATSPDNTPTQDTSTLGTNPDPNDNGTPNDPNEDVPTPVELPEYPVIGIAKAVAEPVLLEDGSLEVTYTIKVKNLGNVPLSAVQVTDNLLATFPEPVTFNLSGPVVTTGSLLANASFDGVSNRELLVAAGSTLALKDSATITFTAQVWLNRTEQTEFFNTAIATAQGPAGGKTVDVSMVGTNPDPNENGDPTENGENEPTPVILDPLVIPKGYSPNGDGVHDNFYIRGLTRLTADVLIYNRWGNLVYQQRNYQNNWNGHSNTGLRVNSELPDGTYYYIIKLNDNRKFAGYLTLAR
jgi:gliding motility-associated-like protein/uncharacterized repeat protein (TIGR01451 family)